MNLADAGYDPNAFHNEAGYIDPATMQKKFGITREQAIQFANVDPRISTAQNLQTTFGGLSKQRTELDRLRPIAVEGQSPIQTTIDNLTGELKKSNEDLSKQSGINEKNAQDLHTLTTALEAYKTHADSSYNLESFMARQQSEIENTKALAAAQLEYKNIVTGVTRIEDPRLRAQKIADLDKRIQSLNAKKTGYEQHPYQNASLFSGPDAGKTAAEIEDATNRANLGSAGSGAQKDVTAAQAAFNAATAKAESIGSTEADFQRFFDESVGPPGADGKPQRRRQFEDEHSARESWTNLLNAANREATSANKRLGAVQRALTGIKDGVIQPPKPAVRQPMGFTPGESTPDLPPGSVTEHMGGVVPMRPITPHGNMDVAHADIHPIGKNQDDYTTTIIRTLRDVNQAFIDGTARMNAEWANMSKQQRGALQAQIDASKKQIDDAVGRMNKTTNGN